MCIINFIKLRELRKASFAKFQSVTICEDSLSPSLSPSIVTSYLQGTHNTEGGGRRNHESIRLHPIVRLAK